MRVDRVVISGFIEEIRERFSAPAGDSGFLIFRGESKPYKNVTSTLLRKFRCSLSKLEVDEKSIFSSSVSDDLIARESSPYFGGSIVRGEEFEALAVLQHYGAPTTLMDFSRDWRVALYFACEKHINWKGRIIFFSCKVAKRRYGLSVREPTGHQHDHSGMSVGREIDQKSILVSAGSGEFRPSSSDIQDISRKYKPGLLAWLRSQGIHRESVYRDVHGYVSLLREDDSWEAMHVAKCLLKRCEFRTAERILNRMIKKGSLVHIEQKGKAIFLLGRAIEGQEEYQRALSTYRKSSKFLLHRSTGTLPRLAAARCAKLIGDNGTAGEAIESIETLL